MLLLCIDDVRREFQDGGIGQTVFKVTQVLATNQSANLTNTLRSLGVVVAQLAERSLPISEVFGSNPDTGKFL